MGDDAETEAVAKAIYMTHWRNIPRGRYELADIMPPPWEAASPAVREWVRKQAEQAIAASQTFRTLNDEIPEL